MVLIVEIKECFGFVVFIDCYFMLLIGGLMDDDDGLSCVDIVLGDCFGIVCVFFFMCVCECVLWDLGLVIVWNIFYVGGYIMDYYGRLGKYVYVI